MSALPSSDFLDLAVPHTVSICASELEKLARACLQLEPVIGNLVAAHGAQPGDIKILQDLDRIQQNMVAISRVLSATHNQVELKKVAHQIPLASLKARILSELADTAVSPGEIDLF